MLDVVAVGEVLWDIIGAEAHLGGAPFNFAAHCCQLGAHSAIISRVGRDKLGDRVLARAGELGAQGCVLRTRRERVVPPGYACEVVDTVGSGDAFAAALVVKYQEGEPLAEVADFANLVGAYVATRRGATPFINSDALQAFAVQTQRSSI